MLLKIKALVVVSFLSVAACAHDSDKNEKLVTYCKEPRPEICTMNYTPVCGLVEDKTVKTFGNACGACGDKKVSQHIPGECQADAIKHFDVESLTNENSKKKS